MAGVSATIINFMKKIKAFTVIELIIGLLISSIVISVSYYVYFLFFTQLIKQQNKNNVVNEFQLFKKVFNNDFKNALSVKDTLDKNMLLINFAKQENIVYLFDQKDIIRSLNEKNDTFNFSGRIDNIQLLDDTMPLITQIQIETIIQKEKINSVFSKLYSAQQIMQLLHHE
jgi:competence protein ComGF